MIIRATLCLGLIWLLLPHDPHAAANASSADASANASLGNPCAQTCTPDRDAVFARLRQIRIELRDAGDSGMRIPRAHLADGLQEGQARS